jgi:hypothetical protein
VRPAVIVLLALLPPPPAAAEDAWRRADEPGDVAVLRIEERGSVLEARGDRLVRIADGRETTLAELPGRPTGAIRDLVDDPWGGTFVAAEHGIFLAHPAVVTVDRCDLADGAPPGSPVGIVLDRQRRLWIATTTSFGVVETVSFYGRTQGPEDGLPAPPYTGLARHPEGGLVLLTAAGAWRYTPELGPPPEITGVTVDGVAWSGRELAPSWPVSLDVSAAGRGAGGASLRYVVDGSHNWLPLPASGAEVAGMNPGRRRIDLVALDRDLRRSATVSIPLTVTYPAWLRPAYLLAAVAALTVAVFATVLGGARRAGGGRLRYGRAAISAGLLVWAALQLVAALFPHARGWPFCGFSMYTATRSENQVRGTLRLVRLADDGRGLYTDFRRFGLPVNKESQIIGPFLAGDDDDRRALLERYEPARGRRNTAALLVVQERERLTREGKVRVPPLVMGGVEAPHE